MTLNVAVIGLGYWGPNLLRNFYQLDGCRVKYGCDLSPKRRKAMGELYKNITFVKDASVVFQDPEVDLVAIATPVASHYQLIKESLTAGKHVLVEKPMTSSVKEGEELVKLAQKKKLVLAVDHTFLFTSAINKIKSYIDKGVLGKMIYFDSERINLGLIRSDVNVLWDLAPHDLSILSYFFSSTKPVSVYATGTKHFNRKVEEMAHLSINFANGSVAHIHVSWVSPVKIRKILVGGSKKMIAYNDLEVDEKIRIYDRGVDTIEDQLEEETAFNPIYRSGDIVIPKLENEEALRAECRHVLDCINKKKTPLVDGKAGLDVVRILEACDKSLRLGRKINL